ncbi:MAG: OadG family protein [Lachnospiraceae bacterium]|nr:OadG family protein [Lachnospiraceae bacterium]
MKKWLLVLGMITCMLGLTACGQEKEEETPLMTEADAEMLGQNIVETINQYVVQNAQDQATDPVLISAIESWESAAEDMGNYVEIISTESELDEKDGVIDVRIKGSNREAIVEIVIDNMAVTTVATNVEYTFGEKMQKAALNTLLGMGTVFIVLILISAIISCFNFIPKIQAKFTKKPNKEDVKTAAVDNTIAQIIEKEELSDDLELVAVISAAIAASEGAASTDGFVVRSIKRAGNKWQRA